MTTIESRRGRVALMVAHCAGMVDLVALPVWVGTLVARYGFDPQQAGTLLTLFLGGAVAASLWVAPRFHRISARVVAPLAFGVSAVAFLLCAWVPSFAGLAALHGVAGLAGGAALSLTHGTVGRTANPHRLFGLLSLALGVFGVVFMGAAPQIIAAVGGAALFMVFGGVMALACGVTAWLFPQVPAARTLVPGQTSAFPRLAWFAIGGISCMAITQATIFSFLERMGADRGFATSQVMALLIALGVVNLLPGPLATLMQRRLDARRVVVAGAVCQAALALVLTWSTSFLPYALAGVLFVAVLIFSHTFCFGLLSLLDPTGRAVAATPAMVMAGAAIGPILGGTLVKTLGYPALGIAALVVNLAAVLLFSRLMTYSRTDATATG